MTSNKIKNLIRGFLAPWRLWQRWKTPLSAMLTTSGIVAIAIPIWSIPHVAAILTVTYSFDTESVLLDKSSFGLDQKAIAQTTVSQAPFPDGIYLYGQSPKPEQIGQEYIVFQVQQGQVVGAVYLPQSEFNCFQGKLDATQLSLTMIYPEELTNAESDFDDKLIDRKLNSQPSASHSVAALTAIGSHLPRNEESITDFHQVNLETYYPITQISNNDRHIVSVCQDIK